MSLISPEKIAAEATSLSTKAKALFGKLKADSAGAPRWLFSSKFFMTLVGIALLVFIGEKLAVHVVYAVAVIIVGFLAARAYETVGLAAAGKDNEIDLAKLAKAVELELQGKGTPESKALLAAAFSI